MFIINEKANVAVNLNKVSKFERLGKRILAKVIDVDRYVEIAEFKSEDMCAINFESIIRKILESDKEVIKIEQNI